MYLHAFPLNIANNIDVDSELVGLERACRMLGNDFRVCGSLRHAHQADAENCMADRRYYSNAKFSNSSLASVAFASDASGLPLDICRKDNSYMLTVSANLDLLHYSLLRSVLLYKNVGFSCMLTRVDFDSKGL